ncbi:MAG: hypothetical protein LUI07_01840 [Lachnospiraceae bacterium]|nr:hypothetical protein [Lachnospiraceae bacterium]
MTLNFSSLALDFNTYGTIGALSEETKAFLKYVGGTTSDDSFVRKLEDKVNTARKNEDWMREYMTLYMRDLENRELGRQERLLEGRKEGLQEGKREEKTQIVKVLLRKGLLSDAEIISVTEVSPEELQEIKKSINA